MRPKIRLSGPDQASAWAVIPLSTKRAFNDEARHHSPYRNGTRGRSGGDRAGSPSKCRRTCIGPSCLSDELGNTATSTGGTTVSCLADPQGGYSWTADTSAAGAIKQWQDRGYTVNIDRVGTAPLDKRKITGVRNPLTITRLNREDGTTHAGELVPIVVSKTIGISLDCAGHS
jgi:hypothetical protein